MQRVLAQTRAIFFELQLFAARFATQRVVVIARLFADQVNDFNLLLTLRHDRLLPAAQTTSDADGVNLCDRGTTCRSAPAG